MNMTAPIGSPIGSPSSVLTSMGMPAHTTIGTIKLTMRTSSLHTLPGATNLRKPPCLPALQDAARGTADATLTPSLGMSASASMLPGRRPLKLTPMESLMSRSQKIIAQAARPAVDSLVPSSSPSPNTKTRRRFAATKQALDIVKDRVSSQDLEDMLDASIGDGQANRKASVQMLKESLRSNLERVTDLFHTLDKDCSGSIDAAEFESGVRAICGDLHFEREDVQALFEEFDRNHDGEITYLEMHRVLKSKIQYKQELLALAEPLPEWPALPPKLVKWRVEILSLHRMHGQLIRNSDGGARRRHQCQAAREPRAPADLMREYVAPAEMAYEKLLRRAAGLSFAELLRLKFPPSARVSSRDCEQMASWADRVHEVKAAHQNLRSLEEDAAVIEALDVDGNGTISKTEFLQLSSLLGLNRAECRLRFREADVAHSGELSIPMTGVVLQTLKKEGAQRLLGEEEPVDMGGRLLHRYSQLVCPPTAGSQKALLPAMR